MLYYYKFPYDDSDIKNICVYIKYDILWKNCMFENSR